MNTWIPLLLLPLVLLISQIQAEISASTFGFPTALDLFEEHYGTAAETYYQEERRLEGTFVSASKTSMGFAYYEFFSDSSCGGNVTYSSGVPAGICLPSIEFDIPGDYYAYGDAYNRTYQSFMINNLKANCEDTQVVFFKDTACTTPVYVQPLKQPSKTTKQTFTSCYANANPASNMVNSYIGKCSIGSTIPVTMVSYVYSEYNSTNRCSIAPLSYEAYTVEVCFGYSNHSSSSFSCSSSTGNITMYQYFDDKICVANPNITDLQINMTIAAGCYQTNTKLSPKRDKYSFQRAQCLLPGSSTPSSNSDSNALTAAAIAGIVIGSVAVVALIAFLGAYFVFGAFIATDSSVGEKGISFNGRTNNVESDAQNPMINHRV